MRHGLIDRSDHRGFVSGTRSAKTPENEEEARPVIVLIYSGCMPLLAIN